MYDFYLHTFIETLTYSGYLREDAGVFLDLWHTVGVPGRVDVDGGGRLVEGLHGGCGGRLRGAWLRGHRAVGRQAVLGGGVGVLTVEQARLVLKDDRDEGKVQVGDTHLVLLKYSTQNE